MTKTSITTLCTVAWLTAVVAAAGCGKHHHEEAADDGHRETATLPLVAYDTAYEIYAEVTPLVAGETARMTVHVTRLQDFKPMEATGRLMVSLATADDGSTSTAAAEPAGTMGLYHATLRPGAAGSGTLRFDVETAEGVTARLEVPGVHIHTDHAAAHREAEAAAAAVEGTVSYPKETSWRVPFATTPARREALGSTLRTMAQVMPVPTDVHVVTARTAGVVALAEGAPAEGSAVRAGQRLLYVDSEGLADGNMALRLREAESESRIARQEYERKASLAADRIVTAADVEQAKARMEQAEATYANLRRHFEGGRQAVTSPVEGTLTQVEVQGGEYVEAGRRLATVVQPRRLRLRADVPVRYRRSLSRITGANVRSDTDGTVHTLEELGGRVVSTGRSAASGLLPVLLEVDATEALTAGGLVEVFLKTQGDGGMAVTVPRGALVEEMGTHFVFVQVTPERFEKRPVRPGATDGLRTKIAEGLAEGERIVTEGAMLVKLAQAGATADAHHGHSH